MHWNSRDALLACDILLRAVDGLTDVGGRSVSLPRADDLGTFGPSGFWRPRMVAILLKDFASTIAIQGTLGLRAGLALTRVPNS